MENLVILIISFVFGIVASTRFSEPEDDILFIIATAFSLLGVSASGAGIITGQRLFV